MQIPIGLVRVGDSLRAASLSVYPSAPVSAVRSRSAPQREDNSDFQSSLGEYQKPFQVTVITAKALGRGVTSSVLEKAASHSTLNRPYRPGVDSAMLSRHPQDKAPLDGRQRRQETDDLEG